MAFTKKIVRKDLTLPSLIDCMFLLNVFSLVTLPISRGNVGSANQNRNVDIALPVIQSKTAVKMDVVLQTLMFEIENQDPNNPRSDKVLYVLNPSIKDSMTLQQAKKIAIRDSLFSPFPDDFLSMNDTEFNQLRPCKMIREEIKRYKDKHFSEPNLSNSIEIRAVKNTEFRIVNYIMEQCSVYGDTIPRVVLRTLFGKGVSRGI